MMARENKREGRKKREECTMAVKNGTFFAVLSVHLEGFAEADQCCSGSSTPSLLVKTGVLQQSLNLACQHVQPEVLTELLRGRGGQECVNGR
jgi:hypothetical protein